jgi:hypothetical protein
MNQILYNIMLINFIATSIYLLFIVYTRVNKKDNIEILFNSEDNYILYKKIKNKHIAMFVVGLLVGLIVVVLFDTNVSTAPSTIRMNTLDVSDVDKIFVKE